MVESAGGYREKYRRAIVEQERMEKQFKFQLDAVRKTLTHVCAAAQGLDKQLDVSLILLKEKMRGASGPQVLEQMERVQQAALDYEHSRRSMGLNASKQVSAIVATLSELKIPAPLRDSLESFSQGLKKRLEAYRNYPDVLQELSKLQALALEAAANPPATFWERLKGGKTLKPSGEEEQEIPQLAQPKPLDAEEDVDEISDAEMDLTPKEGEVIEAADGDIHFDPGDEDSYLKVAARIARTLDNLVTRIEPNEIVKHKIDIVRLRIQRGLDWYSLAVTLEDIRDILLLRYLQNDKEFSEYLKRVNDELASISEALGLATHHGEQYQRVSERLSSAVSDQVSEIRTSMESLGSINDLKDAVNEHLNVIQQALTDYQDNKASQESLTDQLKSLITRVQNIESESQKTKDMLEEERYRATHDSLTGLPNREAYNERAFHELQRFMRYCRPLTLAVCDVDHFKKINDSYGHQAGDKVLKLIAKLISTRLRKVDFVARYGGEEFVILMPETPAPDALGVLDKIRAVIAKTPFKFKAQPVNITISFGLACFSPEDSVEDVFERADKALYKAKNQGRNQCVVSSESIAKDENDN